jgi:Hemerythrin HHE cation binding domain
MQGPLYKFFAEDHDRLEELFREATADRTHVDMGLYNEFRAGLLRHIGMEEKILLPAAQKAGDGKKVSMADKIRLDHGAIAALLVPKPMPVILNALRSILSKHNELEEQVNGMYEVCEELTVNEQKQLLDRLESTPAVPTNPLMEPSRVLDATKRALARAGYNLDDYED